MTKGYFPAIAISLSFFIAACDVDSVPTGSPAGEISRLQALGYRVTASSADGGTKVLRYTGPINASVQCGAPSGQFRTLRPRTVAANGVVQDYKLNSYLIFSSGAARARDGLYVVSRTTRSSSRGAAQRVETIAFEPGDSGTFPSGLSCRAT